MDDLRNPTLPGGLLFIERGLPPTLAVPSVQGPRGSDLSFLNLWSTERSRMPTGLFSFLCLLPTSLGFPHPDVPELSQRPRCS